MKTITSPLIQRLLRVVVFILVSSSTVPFATAEPLLTSWYTADAGKYARVYQTTNDRNNGVTVTTWSGQVLPGYADIKEVSYSASWVYVRYSGLASHIMGPWLNPQGGQFMFWPTNQHGIRRFPRNPVAQSGNKNSTSGGYSGLYVNGVAIFNSLDGQAWNGSGISAQAPHTSLTYYWHRNAPIAEAFNFDAALGHQPPTAIYHTHQNPLALRYQLGDHVDYSASTKTYSENINPVTKHSPILGWAHDGFPIYGPYGYSSPSNAASGIRRMVAGYVERDGTHGTDMVATNLSTIPAWYARFRQKLGAAYSTTASTARASVSSNYPLGLFAEDWSYLGDLTNSASGQVYQQGTDFDLDQYNGRLCCTPEFPNGTYAYFTSIDSSNAATYPYVLAYEFYGTASGGSVSSVTESVTTNFAGGANSSLILSNPLVSNNVVTLTWSAVEGGTYRLESSADLQTWTTNATGISAVLNGGTISTNASAANRSFRIARTGLATYDP